MNHPIRDVRTPEAAGQPAAFVVFGRISGRGLPDQVQIRFPRLPGGTPPGGRPAGGNDKENAMGTPAPQSTLTPPDTYPTALTTNWELSLIHISEPTRPY